MEISKEQALQLQRNVDNKRKSLPTNTIFPEINQENEVLNNPAAFNDIVTLLRIRFQEGRAIFLKGNIPSKKNSKEIQQRFTGRSECCNADYDRKTKICVKCGKTTKSGKRSMLANSKVVQEYIEAHAQDYINNRPLFLKLSEGIDRPLFAGMYLIRDSHRRWDFGNITQVITDLMKDHGLIPDDNTDNIIPLYLGSHVDKNKPGCIIYIVDTKKFISEIIKLI
jgi:hypothetical protein